MTDLKKPTNSTDWQRQLREHRGQIDTIDEKIQQLLSQRAKCALAIADIKRAAMQSEIVDCYRPEREAEVLQQVKDRNQGPLPDTDLVFLFQEIMSCCRGLEQEMKIAYLGPEGTFTQAAVLKHFGHRIATVAMATIDEVFREVASENANYGVVPVANSSEGMVSRTLDSFLEYPLRICGEIELRVHHHLLVSSVAKENNISRIYAHQQALAQCRQWLDQHWPKADRIAVNSNAEAAKRIQGEWHSAAIAGDMAAEIYQLKKVATNIEDSPHNTTRFLVIGDRKVARSGHDKTSVIVAMPDRPGALFDVLQPFKKHNIGLTRVESRPARSDTWSYMFFIDFDGHEQEDQVQQVIAEIKQHTAEFKCIGAYPKAVLS